MADFRNPYVFVPLAPPCMNEDNPLAQKRPAGHDRFHPDLLSGRIRVRIEAVTPLLIPDGANVGVDANANGHKTFDVRRGPDGAPLLPITTYKGALRSGFEAITNSRFGVFERHDAPPARRMGAREGLAGVPLRIVLVNGEVKAELLTGTTNGYPEIVNGQWRAPQGQPLYAAWLPFRGIRALEEANNFEHGEAVSVRLQLVRHHRWSDDNNMHRPGFRFWDVVAINRGHNVFPANEAAATHHYAPQQNGQNYYEPLRNQNGQLRRAQANGYVCWNNRNIKNKHDERIFLIPNAGNAITVDVPDEVADRWSQLIENCVVLHKDEIKERARRENLPQNKRPDEYLGDEPPYTAFSRHTYAESKKLIAGTLTYARLAVNHQGQPVLFNGKPRIEALYPVTIGRELGRHSPAALLPQTYGDLLSAKDFAKLSPADRVFGWVRDKAGHGGGGKGKSAYKGQLRIRSIRCVDSGTVPVADAIQTFRDVHGQPKTLPLAILGQPKIAQARFYVGVEETVAGKTTVEPLADGEPKATTAYFAPNVGNYRLRGRKVYPHHDAPEIWRKPENHGDPEAQKLKNYWEAEKALADSDAPPAPVARLGAAPHAQPLYREYLRRKDNGQNRDSQNRSIRAWVKPGTAFEIEIGVVNMSSAELGGLIWLAHLSGFVPGAHLRLGGGKPLGFGSVTTKVVGIDLATGAQRAERYKSLMPDARPPEKQEEQMAENWAGECARATSGEGHVAAYKTAIGTAYGNGPRGFETVPFIAAFLQSAKGYGGEIPTHYPRTSGRPDPAGKNYEWFVANEKHDGPKLALPEDGKLPILNSP